MKNQEDCRTQGFQGRAVRVWGPFTAFVLLGLLTSCGPKMAPLLPPKPAPTSAAETGLLVRFESADDVSRILENPNAEVRPLHPVTYVYEVNGLTESQIREIAPNLVWIGPNKYHADLKLQTAPRGVPTVLSKLGCASMSPKAMVEIQAPAGLENQKIVKRPTNGAKINLSAKRAVGAPTTGLSFVWLTQAPDGSRSNIQPTTAASLALPIDLMGNYQVLLVAKTQAGLCSAEVLSFGITDNIPYGGQQTPRIFSASDREQFLHLRILQSEESWAIGRGKGVKVAIVDTGVNYNHPDLAKNIATNRGEIAGNGKDDDRNGFIDDAYGYDFANGDPFPLDDQMHGTHVAGLTASAVTGVAPEASILPVKVLNAFGGGDSGSVLAGVKYAADQGAKVINLSLGAYSDDPELRTAWLDTLAYANAKGAIVIAAAGNGDDEGKSVDIDRKPNLPGGLPAPNLLTIASIGLDGKLAPYSNYGLKSVSLSAPGGAPATATNKLDDGLLSTFYEPTVKPYVKSMGTSMASPVAAGVVVLVTGLVPEGTPKQVKDHVMKTALPIAGLKGMMNVAGTIHAFRALQPLKNRAGNTPLDNAGSTPNVAWRTRLSPQEQKAPVAIPRAPQDPSYGLPKGRK